MHIVQDVYHHVYLPIRFWEELEMVFFLIGFTQLWIEVMGMSWEMELFPTLSKSLDISLDHDPCIESYGGDLPLETTMDST